MPYLLSEPLVEEDEEGEDEEVLEESDEVAEDEESDELLDSVEVDSFLAEGAAVDALWLPGRWSVL